MTSFEAPKDGYVTITATEHHDCECSFRLKYSVQTYKWGKYDSTKKVFETANDRLYTELFADVPFHFYRGDEEKKKTTKTDLTFKAP